MIHFLTKKPCGIASLFLSLPQPPSPLVSVFIFCFKLSDPNLQYACGTDTYNEQAIREALQRLAVRQQARQYSAGNISSALKPDNMSRPSSSGSHRRGSLSRTDDRADFMTTHPGSLKRPDSRPGSSTGVRYISKEDYLASQGQGQKNPNGKPPLGKPPIGAGGRNVQTNVHMANANATFNSFIDENTPQWQTEIASAYSQVRISLHLL